MKVLAFFLILSVITVTHLNAQCNTNLGFDDYCDNDDYADNFQRMCHGHYTGGATFDDECLAGWMPSHGSPQVVNLDPYPGRHRPDYNALYMWADKYPHDGVRSEGVLGNFAFQKNFTYKVEIRYLSTVNDNNDYEVRLVLKAVQNVHRPDCWKKGNHLPSVDREQVIGDIVNSVTNWVTATYTFTANNDYQNFWVYPYEYEENQYNVWVDYIRICRVECEGVITYNTGNVPTGNPRFGSVYIGSILGGSGTVSTVANTTTTVIAANDVDIVANFETNVGSGGFIAQIDPCSGGPQTLPSLDSTLNISNGPFPTELDTTTWTDQELIDEYADDPIMARSIADTLTTIRGRPLKYIDSTARSNTISLSGLTIHPNPAINKITCTIVPPSNGRYRIRILNLTGAKVLEAELEGFSNQPSSIDMNVSQLISGVYIIDVIQGGTRNRVYRSKLIKP